MKRFFASPDSPRAQRRLRVMLRVVFAFLVLHFLLVYLAPEWLPITREDPFAFSAFTSPSGIAPGESRVIEEDGRRYLWAGEDKQEHFDITEFRLKPQQLNYGLGREAFPALLKPEFMSAEEADQWFPQDSRVLAVKVNDQVKVYPVDLLVRHEVVNDEVGGRPIFAAYCILADLGAVYDRKIGQHTLTFAVSGYTYADSGVWDGRDAFVLWDRDTESLWWPPLGKAVSGPLIDQPMKVLESALWSQTTWGQVKSEHPRALVLKPGQDLDRPTKWPKLATTPSTTQPAAPSSASAIAPRWGQNTGL